MADPSGFTHVGPPDLSDSDLIRRFREGSEDAFVQLMRRHERRVYNLAYRMLGEVDDARDATQETFLSCFRNLKRFRGDAAFSTWLHRVALNVCYDSLRRRRPTAVEGVEEAIGAAGPDHADQTAASVDVQRALLAVPPEFRAVLIMHEIQDLAVDHIAEAMELPVGTVKSRLHRGRVALARALKREPNQASQASNTTEP